MGREINIRSIWKINESLNWLHLPDALGKIGAQFSPKYTYDLLPRYQA